MQSLKLSDLTPVFQPPVAASDMKRAGAAKDFEALLVSQMLKEAREEKADDDPADDAAMGLGEEEFARAISAAGGLGLAKTIESGLKQHLQE